jgi:hypothetical protein
MADNYCQAVFQPNIPKHLINDEQRRIIEAFSITIEPDGDVLYLYAEDWCTDAHLTDENGTEKDLDEDDLFGCFQEIIRCSNGELKWISKEQAYTCSRMRPDGFGGGALFITADDVQYVSTSEWLEQQIGKFEIPDAEPMTGEPSYLEQMSIKAEERALTGMDLLLNLLETFPQADPESEFYDEEIDGGDAVKFISETVPKIRELLEKQDVIEGRAVGVLEAAWYFIENVSEDDPKRNEKFFALREKVRNIIWERQIDYTILAVTVKGGAVQAVVTDYPEFLPPMNVVVIDYDSRGKQESEMVEVPQEDGTISTANVTVHTINPARFNLTEVLNQLNARDDSSGAGIGKEPLYDAVSENRC